MFFYAYFYRRLLLAVIILPLYDYSVLQVIFSLVLCLFYSCILVHMRPYASKQEQKYERFNEICILLTLYSILLYAEEYIDNALVGRQVGLCLVLITVINIITNIVPVLG